MDNKIVMEEIEQSHPRAVRAVSMGREGYYRTKRVLDFVIALVLLIVLFPFMLPIAIVIYIYSPGPIFFAQDRVGARRRSVAGGKRWERENFRCYKFRTMKLNADTAIHQAYIKALIANDEERMTALQGAKTAPRKLVNDPRIIHPGKILRKLSLDELPQLWNVVRGDMSLVGPRPAIPYEVEMYKPWHLQRLEAQPGITGLQQVKARCNKDYDEQMKLDIQYVENQSLWLDLKIIFQTPLVIISTKGAH
jgi:lipopolysaccharide/colanic/teichoic acid biosynthesis glycosyltransferase